jgi:hypothetical protein
VQSSNFEEVSAGKKSFVVSVLPLIQKESSLNMIRS